jgi:hypothetical protein
MSLVCFHARPYGKASEGATLMLSSAMLMNIRLELHYLTVSLYYKHAAFKE